MDERARVSPDGTGEAADAAWAVARLLSARADAELLEALFAVGAALGAVGAGLWGVADDDADELVLLGERGLPPEEAARLARATVSLGSDPVCAAARARAPATIAVGSGSRAHWPLGRDDGPLLGVWVLAFPAGCATPDPRTVPLLRVAAAAALERAAEQRSIKDQRRQLQRILGMVAHDLRNPLTVIQLCAERLASAEGPPPAERPSATGPVEAPPREAGTVERLRRNAHQANRLVGSLLDLTRAVAGSGVMLSLAPCDLGELARRAADDAMIQAPGRRVEVEVIGELGGRWDSSRLLQCVGNLISNALRHGDPEALVRVRAEGAGERLYLEVHNLGPPIPAALIGRLFEPFARGDEGGRPGLGLGLYIVRHLVEAHAGRVWVTSDVPSGTRFTLELPRVTPDAPTPAGPSPAPPAGAAPLAHRIRDPDLRALLEAYLRLPTLSGPPHPGLLDRATLVAVGADLVWARREPGGDDAPIFVLAEVGPALERRLGRPLRGAALEGASGAAEVGTLVGAYQRASADGKPLYEYARFKTGSGGHTRFERLVLPFSRTGDRRVTDVLAVVRYVEQDAPTRPVPDVEAP